jgi:glycosyltransferase involved in cell wall biosynthesis
VINQEGFSTRVVHIITTLDHGGAEKQLLESLMHFPRTYPCQVFWIKGPGTLQSTFLSKKIPASPLMGNLKAFIKLMLSERFQRKRNSAKKPLIIHAHLPRAELIGIAISKIFRLPLVVSKHNSEAMWPRGNPTISRVLARVVYDSSAKVICISKTVYQYLEGIGELPNKAAKVETVHYGVDLSQLNEGTIEREIRRIVPRIGTLSRYTPQKQLETLIFAAKELERQGLKVEFECHGEGQEKARLCELVETLGLESSVKLLGKILDVDEFIRDCDIFVLTSKYEGFGLVILEAIRNHVPILISNSEAAREVLLDNQDLLFNIGDYLQLAAKIKGLISRKDLYSRNIKISMDLAKRFDINRTVKELVRIYESV